MEQNFDSWTVIQLKKFLKLKGITVSSAVTKLQLINLCKAAEPLQNDPNLYQCSTKEIVQRKLSMIRIVCDPMSLQYNSNFTSHDIPPFGLIDIFNYLVYSRADYDNKKLKAYKSFDDYRQWRLMAFINGGASKTIIEMSKSFIRRLPKFKGGVNKFLANAIFAIAISIL